MTDSEYVTTAIQHCHTGMKLLGSINSVRKKAEAFAPYFRNLDKAPAFLNELTQAAFLLQAEIQARLVERYQCKKCEGEFEMLDPCPCFGGIRR